MDVGSFLAAAGRCGEHGRQGVCGGRERASDWTTVKARDPWPRVAPAEGSPASPLGFFHLSGDVEEWTEEKAVGFPGMVQVRGGSWGVGNAESLSLLTRTPDSP